MASKAVNSDDKMIVYLHIEIFYDKISFYKNDLTSKINIFFSNISNFSVMGTLIIK